MTKDTIPTGLGFSTFGTTHLLWLVAIVAFWTVSVTIYRKLDAKARNTMRLVVGITVVALEIIKNIVMIAIGEFDVGYLPFHLCGINILLIAFHLFKRTKTVDNFLYVFCIPGALLALLFPNWTTLPCLNFSHIHSFVIHAFLVLYPLMLTLSGDIKPQLKQSPKCLALLVAMAIPLYFLNFLWDTNFMFLKEADTGNPLEFFENLLGNHLWGFPILLPIVLVIMYLPIIIVNKVKSKNTEEKQLANV